jgi:hypothetical protein
MQEKIQRLNVADSRLAALAGPDKDVVNRLCSAPESN